MRKQRIRRELAGCPGPSFAQDDELGVEPVRETIAEQSRWVRQPMVIESLVGVGVDDGWEGGAARTKLAGGRRAGHRMLGRRRSGSCCGAKNGGTFFFPSSFPLFFFFSFLSYFPLRLIFLTFSSCTIALGP
ncbi:hypothetical protein IF1G_06997 [Cordyceps javanica]|uniref:Uncharacterized protein n=1 Tax=Cordyceps javanica TaxID=43265 RepID=A0A545UXF0_9HYPO|nr:hypothetical protein IF1G_06997 [Cordyceps javanica]